jgi:hypothetical protein
MNEKLRSTKPHVDRVTSEVKVLATSVSDRISKEIFDDEIFQEMPGNKIEDTEVQEVGLFAAELDLSIQDEPVQFERQIINKVKRKNNMENLENKIEETEEVKGVTATEEKKIFETNVSGNDLVNINNAIERACRMSDRIEETPGKPNLG